MAVIATTEIYVDAVQDITYVLTDREGNGVDITAGSPTVTCDITADGSSVPIATFACSADSSGATAGLLSASAVTIPTVGMYKVTITVTRTGGNIEIYPVEQQWWIWVRSVS